MFSADSSLLRWTRLAVACALTLSVAPINAQNSSSPSWCGTVQRESPEFDRNAPTYSIMTMGASIAYGLMSADGNGFRLKLEQYLEANGTQTTMVGTQWSGNMTDNHHEAYPGLKIADYNNKTYHSGAYELGANIYLVHIGTNDCWWVDGEDGTGAAQRMGYLLDSIHTKSPDALVLQSSVIRSTQEKQNECLLGLNSHLPAVVDRAVAKGQYVRLVDMYDVVPADQMQPDGTHPTDIGYHMMSQQWFNAIQNATRDLCVDAPPEAVVNTTTTDGATSSSEPTAASSSSASSSSVQEAASTQSATASTPSSGAGQMAVGYGLLSVLVPAAMWALGA